MVRHIRYGIIGTGMMGCEHILNIAHIDHASVTAIAETNPTSVEWAQSCLGERASDVAVYDNYVDLLTHKGLDAVIIATPNMTHKAILDDVLATDCAVMIEKPLCTTVQDCIDVRDRARERSALVWVALEYRYMPTIAAVIDEVKAGVCGDLKMVSIREHRFPFLDKVDNWNRFTRNTGGTLVEKCCHFFDLMAQIAESTPTRVMASGGQDVNHLDEQYNGEQSDILDNAFVIVDFENGVRGLLDLCMFAEGGRYEQELTIVGSAAKIEATVPGNEIWIGKRHTNGQTAIATPQSSEVEYVGFHHGSSYLEHLRFLEQVRSESDSLVTVDDGLWSVAMGAAAHRSIDEGRPVQISEFGL